MKKLKISIETPVFLGGSDPASTTRSGSLSLLPGGQSAHSSATLRPFTAQGDHDEVLEGSFYMKEPNENIKQG